MKRIGIDNGINGAISVLDEDKEIIEKIIMPTIGKGRKEYNLPEIFKFLEKYSKDSKCILEKAQPRFRDGSKQAFKTGYGFGVMEMALTALKIPYIIVTPQAWQKQILKGINCADTKKASALYCTRRYPNEDFTPTLRAKKIHDGLTDATCIAGYEEFLL